MFDIFKSLRRFDAYPKTLEDVKIQTLGGGILTFISLTIMSLLFWIELYDYLTPNVTEELFVDTSRNPTINIQIDITVLKVSCDFIALDAMDSSGKDDILDILTISLNIYSITLRTAILGEQHLEISHSIFKRKLDLNGAPIEEPQKEEVNKVRVNETKEGENRTKVEYCGSCYGAADRCCNTCEDVREAYREKRWALDDVESVEQCKNEKFNDKLKAAFNQSCQIFGDLTVNRVSGSFHIAPGKSFGINHVHVHDVQPFSSGDFNMTHRIKRLTFGTSLDSESHNPLKDFVGVAEEGATMFQYYLKIVPTSYVKKDGAVIHSNQFSVTKHQKVVSIMSGESGMPGVFFQYELSPLMVKYTEKERSFGHFLTNVCAIIGGVYTVAGLLDTFLYHSVKIIQKKMELGKLH